MFIFVDLKKPAAKLAGHIKGDKEGYPGKGFIPMDVPDQVGVAFQERFRRSDGRTIQDVVKCPDVDGLILRKMSIKNGADGRIKEKLESKASLGGISKEVHRVFNPALINHNQAKRPS